tara:strand:- start:18 stop:215 length:198 start_codon:yes stop_codon:yes gene_type:complete
LKNLVKKLDSNRVKTERELFLEKFPKTLDGNDKSYSMEYSIDGKILKIKTDDEDIIKWAKTKGIV